MSLANNRQVLRRRPGEHTGRLRVKVNKIDAGKPLPGATVRVTPHGRADRVLYELKTDVSGQTDKVELAAPPVEYSYDPDGGKPYAEYDVYSSKDGYSDVTVECTQIYPGITALQHIRMYPRDQPAPSLNRIVIPPNTLWGDFPPKIPESEVKELPPATGFVVLPEPVIPEFMIVHDGVPSNAFAKNYWVPFADYVKNVTSSEIYATWPEETIRANVLAIISIALNRVFTEWYRAKGFSFMITSSTQYDQKFIYGRNIFAEISVIVDEIFNTYITRPHIRQPLFTQYCDGRRSQCPGWMQQWASKDLGVKGMSALNILKHFYGSNIYLSQASKVEGVPMSFPNVVQQLGSTGEPVRRIQSQINTIANNFPAIPRLRVDGIYGEATKASVQKFQSIFNLPQHGVVDFATWYSLTRIYVAVTRMAELVP